MRRLRERIRNSADLRLAFHHGAWQFVLVLAAGLLIKLFVLDSAVTLGTQMEPEIKPHDRLLIFKLPYKVPLVRDIFTRQLKPVVASISNKGTRTLLRIAAVSGDTVNIEDGQFFRNNNSVKQFRKDTEIQEIIPAAFSPMDFMTPYKIPEPMDTITFEELTMRDLIFTYSVIRQERSDTKIKAFIVKGGEVRNDLVIRDFTLYSGRLDSIPDEYYADWFFWDRLQSFLDMTSNNNAGGDKDGAEEETEDEETPQLAFSIFRGGREIQGFRVTKSYVFLMGDNWTTAKDSRYWGPVAINNIVGRPFLTVWGWNAEEDSIGNGNGGKSFDWNRVFKIIR